MRVQAVIAAGAVVSLAAGIELSALGVSTHVLINREAARTSARFEVFVREGLGFREGRTTFLRSAHERLTIEDWLSRGGVSEDDAIRFLNHFHDPLKPWDLAGLKALFRSSVRWMQRSSDETALFRNKASWQDARRLYYDALVEPDAARRDALWAALFVIVGQMMHLVVDASVPEHTRDDIHLLGAVNLGSSYERWVAEQHGATVAGEAAFIDRYLSTPIGFAPEILALAPPAGETVATVPVARLIDADRYDGTNARVTADPVDSRAPVAAGIAEIANANFFSEDTLRGSYPSPADEGLVPVNLATPSGKVRRYWSRPAGQALLPANPLRAECASDEYAGEPAPYPCVDPLVWGQVAAHMLPRAVGYASGVLDYFFRGSLAITQIEWAPAGISLVVRNSGTEVMNGVFDLYARHDPGTPAERRVKVTELTAGEPVLLDPGDPWRFDLTVPPDVVPASSVLLVFRGRLGMEEGAVFGQAFTVPHVEVRQTTYDADVRRACARRPPAQAAQPYVASTLTLLSERTDCEWWLFNHRVAGTLQTNVPSDPVTGEREPVIQRIEAVWRGGDRRGPAPLVIDGVPVGSVWERRGGEPDPTAFAIIDPADRGGSDLYLSVSYARGGQVDALMAIFNRGLFVHSKSIVLHRLTAADYQYLVKSERSFTGQISYNHHTERRMAHPLFEAVSHGGAPAPLDARTWRKFGGFNFPEGLHTLDDLYVEGVIDHYEEFAQIDKAHAQYGSIEPLLAPHPDGPVYTWTAQVRRRFQPMEREFLRAFVTTNPDPYVVTLTGHGGDE
jgi:hypothetical protein